MLLDNTTSAALGTMLGGIVTLILKNRHKIEVKELDEASDIRHELRENIKTLNTTIDVLRVELDKCRDRFYELSKENVSLRARCMSLEVELKALNSRVEAAAP